MNASTMLVIFAMCLLATGCASILEGPHQHLSVATRYKDTEVVGARCRLNNDKGTWTVTTPGSVTVARSYGDLSAECEKEGIARGSHVFKSAMKAVAFVYMLVGGIVGTAIDMVTGAAYKYPSSMTVEMGGTGDLAQSDHAVLIP